MSTFGLPVFVVTLLDPFYGIYLGRILLSDLYFSLRISYQLFDKTKTDKQLEVHVFSAIWIILD